MPEFLHGPHAHHPCPPCVIIVRQDAELQLQRHLDEYHRMLPTALSGEQAELLQFLHAIGTQHKRPSLSPRVQPTKLPVKQETMRRLWESRKVSKYVSTYVRT